MATRHYKMIDRQTQKVVAVIEAQSKQQSWSYMAQGLWACEVASSKDVVEAVKAGTPLLDAMQPATLVSATVPDGVDAAAPSAPQPDYSEFQPQGHSTPEQG